MNDGPVDDHGRQRQAQDEHEAHEHERESADQLGRNVFAQDEHL